MVHRLLLHNDEIRDAGDRVLAPGQVGLLNGWGVFSTLRVCDGVLFAWERHWARMQKDAAKMRVPFPREAAWLEERLHRLVDANRAWISTLRVAIVRNRGGMFEGPPTGREFDVVAFTADRRQWGETASLGVAPNARFAAGEFAGTKYLSWSENLTWYERAREQGLDEMLLLNERGEVSECTSANLFVAEGGRAWTPPLHSGCLPGVTRSLLLEEVRAEGVEVGEKTLLPADLEAADEVFITSTTRELLPVASIQGLAVRRHGDVRRNMQRAFTKYIGAYVEPRRRSVAAM